MIDNVQGYMMFGFGLHPYLLDMVLITWGRFAYSLYTCTFDDKYYVGLFFGCFTAHLLLSKSHFMPPKGWLVFPLRLGVPLLPYATPLCLLAKRTPLPYHKEMLSVMVSVNY
jgi:hypothetical protein